MVRHSSNFIKMALMFIMSASLFSASASELQDKKDSWFAISNELSSLNTKGNLDLNSLIKKNDLLPLEYKARSNYLHILAKEYLKGNIESRRLNQDFKNLPEAEAIMEQFSVELLMESLQKLKNSKVPEIELFMKRYKENYDENAIPLFRLAGSEINKDAPTEEKGGFHRGNSSIFMNITKTSSGEWLFILSHELFHALDRELYSATRFFANEEILKSIQKMTKGRDNLVELSTKEISILDQWIMAGLNKGLLAEHRAWLFGFSIYEKGITEGLWKKIPFVEQVLSFKDKNEDLSAFVYRYLNERSKNTTEGILGRPIIQQKVQEKRDQLGASFK